MDSAVCANWKSSQKQDATADERRQTQIRPKSGESVTTNGNEK
jgi:pyruvate-formate lyase-activating enzyme